VINRLPAVNPIGLFPDTVRGDHHTIQRNPDIESDELEPGFKLATHLHGAPSPPYYDGYPNDLIPPNYYKDYIYNNEESVRTLWYHDHEFFKTTQNLYSGLAGLYELTSAEDEALLPQGEFDVSLMVKDVQIGQNGQLAFDDDGHDGVWGNVITVNGVPWPTMSVKPRVYRFRVLNASTARSYGFRLSNNDPVTFVSGDGGFMIRPTPANFWRHATAERYGFLIDFSEYRPGTRIQLLNQSPDNNEDFEHTDKVMEFVVEGTNDFSRANNIIPSSLPTEDVMRLTPADAVRKRLFRFERQGGEWTINGSTWHDVIESNFEAVLANPGVGDTEIWTIDNRSGGWAHPVHLHLVDFKILHRNGRAPFSYEKSPKDTVFLNGNEVVDIIMRFNREGKYVFHCHNSSHEDHDMMHQFRVGPRRNPDPHSPFKVPARPIGS
jgi:FtsP/CotA-like multicopper oxidase with cupredoxin domain